MKVLCFTTMWPNHMDPLNGLFVRERINTLAQFCDVQVVAPVPWFLPTKMFGEQYYKYSQVRTHEQQGALKVFHPRFLVFPKVGKFLDGILMFYSVRKFVQSIHKNFGFELIDAHYAYPDGYAGGLLAQTCGVPYVVTVRGSDMNVLAQERFRGACIRQTLMHANHVICVSRSLQELVVALGIPSKNTTVLENGVDPQKFYQIPKSEARRKLQLPQEAKIFLSVGHLVPQKGFHFLIQAFQELLSKQHDMPLRLIIVGEKSHWDPSYQDVLVRQVAEHGLQELVLFAGSKQPDELKYWYSAADLFCLATSREGCPNVVLESLACGTPVVATAVSGIPDIISNAKLGILVEQNVLSIRQGLIEALERTWDSDQIIAHIHQHYSWKTTAIGVYNIFKHIV